MPLVPKATYSAWFHKSSWVYRAYSFLYVNPLWTKTVPSGSSLCVFWWSALFALFILRPLVYLTLGLRAVVGPLHLGALIRFTDNLIDETHSAPRGLPTVVLLLVLTIVSVSFYLIYGIGIMMASAGVLSCFALPAIAIATALSCYVYTENHKGDSNRCPVEVYCRIILALCVGAAALLQPEIFVGWFLGSPVKLLALLWAGIAWVGSGCWSLIAYLLTGLVTGFVYVWIGVFAAVFMAIYGWLASKWGWGMGLGEDDKRALKLSREEVRCNLATIAGYIHSQDTCHYSYTTVRDTVFASPECMDLAVSTPTVTREQAISLTPFVFAAIQAGIARKAARSESCKRVTAALIRLCSPVVVLTKQLGIAASYLWAFAKAKKGNVCPYLRFED